MFCLKWNSQKCCFQFSWDWRNSTKTEKEINLQIYDIKLSDWIMTSQSTRRNVRPSASNETLTNAAFTRTSSLLVSSTSETWSCKWEKWSSFSVQWSSYLLVVHVSIAESQLREVNPMNNSKSSLPHCRNLAKTWLRHKPNVTPGFVLVFKQVEDSFLVSQNSQPNQRGPPFEAIPNILVGPTEILEMFV